MNKYQPKMEFTFVLVVKNMYLFREFSYGKQILCCFSNDGGLKGSPFENYLRLSTSHFVAIAFHVHTLTHLYIGQHKLEVVYHTVHNQTSWNKFAWVTIPSLTKLATQT